MEKVGEDAYIMHGDAMNLNKEKRGSRHDEACSTGKIMRKQNLSLSFYTKG